MSSTITPHFMRTGSCSCKSVASTSMVSSPANFSRVRSRRSEARGHVVQASYETMDVLTKVIGVGIAAAGAWIATSQGGSQMETRPKCARCSGSGYEECVLCSRWSSSKTVGCDTCGHTGRMRCRACGGGGTAVPIDTRMRVMDSEQERRAKQLLDPQRRTRNWQS